MSQMLHAVDAELRTSFREIYPRLFRFVFSRTSLNPSDVDDLVQETLAHGWQRRREFLEHSSFETWLLSIARHKIADYWRSRRTRSRAVEVAVAIGRLHQARVPDELLRTAEMRERVDAALQRLDDDYAR